MYLSREGVTAHVPLTALMSDNAENIYVWPGDSITMLHQPKTFEVMGATVNNNEISFGAQNINLIQALAKAGGLQDTRADPSGIYLLRFEPADVVKAVGGTGFLVGSVGLAPIIYHLNLQEISGYFLAERFSVRDRDILYIANSRSDSAQKLFNLIGTLSGPILGGAVITRGR